MARKVVMTSVRVEKKLNELMSKGYKLRQELVTCNSEKHFSKSDFNTLNSLGLEEIYRGYPLNRLQMFFVCDGSVVEICLQCEEDSTGRMSVENYSYEYVPFFSTEEAFVLFTGDEVPEELEGNISFELSGSLPLFYSSFNEKGILMENMCLWRMFNDYEIREACEAYDKNILEGISNIYYEDLTSQLEDSGLEFKNSKMFDGVEVSVYSDEEDTCHVHVINSNTISFIYSDIYSNLNEDFAKLGIDLEKGMRSFIEKSQYEFATMPAMDMSDVLLRELCTWKYKASMLNNNVNEALFRFNDLDLEDLLGTLQSSSFTFDSIGMVNVRSIVNSITVCGFKNFQGYSYIVFFYSPVEETFMVRVISSKIRLKEIIMNESIVHLVNASLDDYSQISTLIRGFDFENFKEYELV